MKKVGKYLLILLLLLTGLFFVALLFLFFVPHSSLFGITYVGKNSTTYSQPYSVSNVNSIVLNSNAFDIKIVSTDVDKVSLKVENKMFGFALKKHSAVTITPKLYNKTLTFNVDEPYGATFKNGSAIELRLPKNNTFNLTINNKSAAANMNCGETSIKELNYETNRGSLQISKANITGNINLKLKSGSCAISKDATLNHNAVTLSQTSGKFTTEEGVVLGDITHTSNSTGNVSVYECDAYTGLLGEAGGNINIGKAKGKVEITSTDTNVTINNQNANSEISLTKSGNIKINNALSTNLLTNVKTNNGDIIIGSANYNIIATSTNGDIKINNMHTLANVSTERGNISITYASDAAEYNGNDNRKAIISTYSGNVNVVGVENITLDVDKGNATITMKEVYGTNNLTAKNGSIKVVTPSNLGVALGNTHKYILTTQTGDNGTVFVGISACDEYTKKELTTLHVGVAAGSTLGDDYPNKLTVTSTANGSIRVVNAELD